MYVLTYIKDKASALHGTAGKLSSVLMCQSLLHREGICWSTWVCAFFVELTPDKSFYTDCSHLRALKLLSSCSKRILVHYLVYVLFGNLCERN